MHEAARPDGLDLVSVRRGGDTRISSRADRADAATQGCLVEKSLHCRHEAVVPRFLGQFPKGGVRARLIQGRGPGAAAVVAGPVCKPSLMLTGASPLPASRSVRSRCELHRHLRKVGSRPSRHRRRRSRSCRAYPCRSDPRRARWPARRWCRQWGRPHDVPNTGCRAVLEHRARRRHGRGRFLCVVTLDHLVGHHCAHVVQLRHGQVDVKRSISGADLYQATLFREWGCGACRCFRRRRAGITATSFVVGGTARPLPQPHVSIIAEGRIPLTDAEQAAAYVFGNARNARQPPDADGHQTSPRQAHTAGA